MQAQSPLPLEEPSSCSPLPLREGQGEGQSALLPLMDPGVPESRAEIPCFQCGVCCMKWQPLLAPAELQELAAGLGMRTRIFNRRYTRPYPLRRGWRQLRTGDTGGCVFLAFEEGRAICTVYAIRPTVCRDWKAGLDKRECLEGMKAVAAAPPDSSRSDASHHSRTSLPTGSE